MVHTSADRAAGEWRRFNRADVIAQRLVVAIFACSLAYLPGCRGRSEEPGEAVWAAVAAAYGDYSYELPLRDHGLGVSVQTVHPGSPQDEQWELHSTPITDVWLPNAADAPVVKEQGKRNWGATVEVFVKDLRIVLMTGADPELYRVDVQACDIEPIYEGLENAGLGSDQARKVADGARRRLLALNSLELTERYLSADHRELKEADLPEEAAEIGLLLLARKFGSLPASPAWRVERGDEVIHIVSPSHHSVGNGMLITAVGGPEKMGTWWGIVNFQNRRGPGVPPGTAEILSRVFAPTGDEHVGRAVPDR